MLNLITDRTQADVEYLRGLLAKGWYGMTDEEKEWMLNGVHKGAYEASDLNRVTAAVDFFVSEFKKEGTIVRNRKIEIEHAGASRLPEGYTELEYIESTGTQYVDTGFNPNQDTRVVVDVYFTAQSTYNAIFGARIANLTDAFILYYSSGGSYFRDDYADVMDETISSPTGRYSIDKNKNVTSINENSNTFTADTFQCTYSMYLFATNNSGTAKYLSNTLRLYSCKIYDNGTIIRDFVPCCNEDTEVGFYDVVNGVFYGNAGTGTFVEGPEVTVTETEEKDPYTWYKEDQPTDAQMSAYLFNVAALKAEINGETELPSSMVDLTVDGANAIERLLLEVPPFMERLRYSKMYAGEVFAGE